MAYSTSAIVNQKISQALSPVKSRLAEISSQTGVSFGSILSRADGNVSTGSINSGEGSGNGLATAQMLTQNSTGTSAIDSWLALQKEKAAKSDSADTAKTSETKQTEGTGTVYSSDYSELISQKAKQYGIPAELIRAVMFNESGFDKDATSGSGAMGLMQLMPYVAEELGVTDPYDPEQSTDGGAKLLARYLDQYNGDGRLAVAAYHCGSGGISSRGITDLTDSGQRDKLPDSTLEYLCRIENYLESRSALGVLGK